MWDKLVELVNPEKQKLLRPLQKQLYSCLLFLVTGVTCNEHGYGAS